MKFLVMRAQQSDAPAMAQAGTESFVNALGQYFTDPVNMNDFIKQSFSIDVLSDEMGKSNVCYWVCKGDDALLGFAKLTAAAAIVPPDVQKEVELERFYFSTAAQGSGAAEATMQKILAWAAATKVSTLRLRVYVENHRAIRFYLRMGFVISGQQLAFVGTQEFLFYTMTLSLPNVESV